MEAGLLLLVSLASGGAVLALLARLSRSSLQPAPAPLLAVFAGVGALSVFPGLVLYGLADALGLSGGTGRWASILFVWTVNAPAEEAAKYLSFALASHFLRSIRRPQDGSLQGAATGLGFGLVENFLYGLAGGWELLVLRAFVSLPGHVIYGAVWGGYHGFEAYQSGGRVRRWWIPGLALVPAAFSHALFNTLALGGAPLAASLVGDAVTLGFGLFLFLRLRSLSPERASRPLRDWALAVPELEHALALDPSSAYLRRRLAAYLLAGGLADRALATLDPLPPAPWTDFYRDAARSQLAPSPGAAPASAALNPRLFEALSRRPRT